MSFYELAGISINGTALQMDRESDERFYHKFGIKVNEILGQNPKAPKQAQALKDLLNKHAM